MKTKIKPISPTKKVKLMQPSQMEKFPPEQIQEARKALNQAGSGFQSYYQSGFLVVTRIA